MHAKRPPDAEGAERPKNKADESNLWANEFNRKLTYRKRSSWAEQDGQIPSTSSSQTTFVYTPQR